MLKIDKKNIWVMWPDFLVDNFIDYPSNKIFDYDGNFSFLIEFELNKKITDKMTLFAKLPTYFGIDLEENNILLILNQKDKETEYITSNYTIIPNEKYKLEVKKKLNNIKININNHNLFDVVIHSPLKTDDRPHIIFGAGNFPKNGYNLNYFDGALHYLSIKKENVLIAEHDFEKFIHNKSYDLTDNCNFIHKI